MEKTSNLVLEEPVKHMNERFGGKVGDDDMGIFRSIRTIADFIRDQRGE